MAEYFLPDVNCLKELKCDYELKILHKKDFTDLYKPEWGNALCEKRKELDVLGVAAYDGDKMIGLAACSADCDSMWQIGVDVLPEYRRKGIAIKTLDLLVQDAKKRGITAISLEATAMGRPLYEKYGFIAMNEEMELPN